MRSHAPASRQVLLGIATLAVGVGSALAGSGAAHAEGHRGSDDGPARATASDHRATPVSNLIAGKTYNLYRYTSTAAIPDSKFNANSAKAAQKWQIVATGPTYTMTQTIMSNEIAAYRAVPSTAG